MMLCRQLPAPLFDKRLLYRPRERVLLTVTERGSAEAGEEESKKGAPSEVRLQQPPADTSPARKAGSGNAI